MGASVLMLALCPAAGKGLGPVGVCVSGVCVLLNCLQVAQFADAVS